MSLEKRNLACKTNNTKPRSCLRHRDKALSFDPLGNGNLALRINYQKVSRLKESQEVASKWGLGRSP